MHLNSDLKDTYIVHYLEGFALCAMGNYLESTHSFDRSIKLKEGMSLDGEERCVELENIRNLIRDEKVTKRYS